MSVKLATPSAVIAEREASPVFRPSNHARPLKRVNSAALTSFVILLVASIACFIFISGCRSDNAHNHLVLGRDGKSEKYSYSAIHPEDLDLDTPKIKVALPSGFNKIFIIPDGRLDQYGNPVISRDGSKYDLRNGFPFEIWLASPRMEFIQIPCGEFYMGSPVTEIGRSQCEGPVHLVTFVRPVYLSKYEITQGQWGSIMSSNPSRFINAGKNAPVEHVSWFECKDFLNKLNDRFAEINIAEKGISFRLPSEAEWEYACRSGTRTTLYNGSMSIKGHFNSPELDLIAWYGGNSVVTYKGGHDSTDWPQKQFDHIRAGTNPVGRKSPNRWGLYDMIGNVEEWCEDKWNNNYSNSPIDGRAWIEGSIDRVVRGGSWDQDAKHCRSAARFHYEPHLHFSSLGFRVCISTK